MIGFICLFFPAVIFCYMRRRKEPHQYSDKKQIILRTIYDYVLGNIAINSVLMLLRAIISHRTDDVSYNLNNYSDLAVKYLVVSIFLAFIFPTLFKILRENTLISHDIAFKGITISERTQAIFVFLYGLILACHHAIRMLDNSVWGDEGIVVLASRKTFFGMLQHVANSGHSPFHYAFAWICVKLFGESGLVYHFSATLPYFIIVAVAIFLVRKWFGSKAALVFITLCSLLDCTITYNLEIRMYVWCQLFILLTFLMFYKLYLLNSKDTKYYILASVFSTFAAYSHYFALASIGLMYFVFLVYILKINAKKTWKVIASGGSVLLLLLPWLIYAKKVRGSVISNYRIGEVPWKDCIEFIFHSKCSLTLFALFWIVLIVAFIYDIGMVNIKMDAGKLKFSLCFNSANLTLRSTQLWIASGLFGVFGTITTAQIISTVLYPIIVLRYLYVSYIIIWLIFSICISRTKLSSLWCPILIIFVFSNCYLNCIDAIKTEMSNNKRLKSTIETTVPMIDEKDFIYTDSVHFAWTVEESYYPNTPRNLFGHAEWWGPAELPVLDNSYDYWLFLQEPISDAIILNLSNQGRHANLIVDNGYMGVGNMWIYQIVDGKIKE